MQTDSELRILKKFVTDTTVFDELNAYLTKGVNVFEIAGIINREVKHSMFLAWLLDPSEKHGLNDWFFKKILENLDVTAINGRSDTDVINTLLYNYSDDLDVFTEWTLSGKIKRADILAVSEENKLVVCIENKIWSGEHDNQLLRIRRHGQCEV